MTIDALICPVEEEAYSPRGFPGLSAAEYLRTETANELNILNPAYGLTTAFDRMSETLGGNN